MSQWDSQSFGHFNYSVSELGVQLMEARITAGGRHLDLSDHTPTPLPLVFADTLSALPAYEALEEQGEEEAWEFIELKLDHDHNTSEDSNEIHFQVVCEATRLEHSWLAHSDGPTQIQIPMQDIRSKLAVRALGVDNTGRMNLLSKSLEITVDRPITIFGEGMAVIWDKERFHDCPGLLSILEFDDDEPTLYINDNIPNFKTLLSRPRRTLNEGLKQLLLSQIESDTWHGLGLHILSRLSENACDINDEDLGEEDIADTIGSKLTPILDGIVKKTGIGSRVATLRMFQDVRGQRSLRQRFMKSNPHSTHLETVLQHLSHVE